ncbi:hypothetical protein [Mucilaginibacter sp. FT3.2]|uniref:hypothetical protein n=1 Tax=Mucilaginibacter sp. FT3.2 TaxID=2723090 RepID=UPI00161452DD|nr:hypothetical protein [Mucilaginibacter sp. FT3.2]MBB6234195.1 hypothetical protein [Mucilaginibacter sp. FT3.2]
MKNNKHKLPKKEVRSLYALKGAKAENFETTTSTSGDTTGTCTTVTTTTHFG